MILWVLGILIILAVWTLWFLFPPDETGAGELIPTWLAITISVVVIGLLIALWAIRRIRAARAARALEKAIAQQAQEQALAAKPEEREEIQALYRQIAEGINALKTSKLGGGRKGEHALYALPWYAIVGPPGAGKTTALRHSGLQFPFLDPQSGGAVKGVGGTRNCDWWFTNEAILLDTAGRYTTEVDDRDEWIAFLEQLMKYRPEKPLNGVLVAVSVSDLLDATEDQIRVVASKVRARIDEMQSTLKMTLPVYVMFTKSDLVAGFVEFFGDLKKSERGQPWGTTFGLREGKTEPGRMFEREFDLLVEKLHERVTKRMNNERSRPVKERVYQFPLEFAAIKRNLADFMQAAFAPSGGTVVKEKGGKKSYTIPEPILRGFYFTSGTQEGKPLDRVVGAMGRAFGLKGSVLEEPENKESRSYFLRDVFLRVVFPDQNLAAMSQSEIRRRLVQKLAFAAGATIIALLFTVPAVISYLNNQALVAKTNKISTETGKIKWDDASSSYDKVARLDELRGHLEQLKDWNDNGKPISYSWFMYRGEDLFEPTKNLYISSLEEGFIKPTRNELERRVKAVTGQDYLPDYNNLKTYLLLEDTARLKDPEYFDFQIARLTQIWGELLSRTSGGVGEEEMKRKIGPHVRFFISLQRDGNTPGLALDPKTVAAARERLRASDQEQAYYDLFVRARNEEKIDPTKPDGDRTNLRFPPILLSDIFTDRSDVRTILSSKDELPTQKGKPAQVDGAFTAEAFKIIDKLLADEAAKLLEREAWVVPYDREEKLAQETIETRLKNVRKRYEDAYIAAWTHLFEDVDTKIPLTNGEAITEFKILSTPDWPYRRLVQTLADNTQFADDKVPAGLMADGGVLDQIEKRVRRRIEGQTNIRLEDLQANVDISSKERIKRTFETVVKFGITPPYVPPPPAPDGTRPPEKPPVDPELTKYVTHLEKLASEMQVIEEGPLNTETADATKLFTQAVKDTEAMILKLDPRGQNMMREMLLNPLRQGYKAFIKGAGGAASGLWEVMVWPHYRDKIKDRYPFNLAAKRDASFEDAKLFFKPKDGVLWGFYEKYLTNFHRKQEHDFIPVSFLQGGSGEKQGTKPAAKRARGSTPFNPLMYNCLKRADEITDALWGPGGGEDPQVKFQINLKTVSPIVSDIVFTLDGQKRVYRNEKEFWYEFAWPGEEKRGASIQLRGAGGLDELIVRDGPWGIFRLFESADKITAVKDSDSEFTVSWTMSAPPVTVTMQVRPRRGNHPFPLSFFRNTNCPPSIGDSFGGGDAPKEKN
ncbi:MAG: type VI secretion system membrane subunit TssM [Polyangiaceae bacterium]|nr:type VI secretion system membrane subunit TssM [Polyangiaceae bacterium]